MVNIAIAIHNKLSFFFIFSNFNILCYLSTILRSLDLVHPLRLQLPSHRKKGPLCKWSVNFCTVMDAADSEKKSALDDAWVDLVACFGIGQDRKADPDRTLSRATAFALAKYGISERTARWMFFCSTLWVDLRMHANEHEIIRTT